MHSSGAGGEIIGASFEVSAVSAFNRRWLATDIILVCVRWYCKYGISYRDFEEMKAERVRRGGWTRPSETINTYQNEACGKAIRALGRACKLDKNAQHRQVKYLNNRLEAEHGALKRLNNPTRVSSTPPAASATVKAALTSCA